MPRIKSLLNGEVSNVRGDIARELIRMGVAEALEPLEETVQKGRISVTSDGTVHSPGELPYRVPKSGDSYNPGPQWEVCIHTGSGTGEKVLCIRMTLGNAVTDYFGPPAQANARKEWQGGGRHLNFGIEVPKEILKLYERQYKDNPSLRGPEGSPVPDATECPENASMADDLAFRKNRRPM